MVRIVLVLGTLVSLLFTPVLFAAEESGAPATSVENSESIRAQALLAKAVEHFKAKHDQALLTFMRSGEFVSGELYVYVIGTNGAFLSSGGSSSALIGRDVTNMRDAAGKEFFREMLDTAKSKGSGQVEYRWLNRVDGKVERKVTYFQKVGNRIIAVGYYIPRASQEQAKAMLEDAVAEVKKNPASAFAAFNDLNGKFIQDDLYVFVVDLKDSKFRAHGATPRMIGTGALDLKDPKGKPLLKEMIASAGPNGKGSLQYHWRNPVTEKVEAKRTFVRKVDNYLVGVGYYIR